MRKLTLLCPVFLIVFLFLTSQINAAHPTSFVSCEIALGVKLDIRVYLKGALVAINPGTDILMRDDLRKGGYLPNHEPYSAFSRYLHMGGGNETIADSSVLMTTGPNAIVDWLFVELRNAENPVQVATTRSALLQRDGDVVDTDGFSSLLFENIPDGNYYVAVRHRNHFGVMTAHPYTLSYIPTSLDFTNPDFATWGDQAQQAYTDKMALWAGDINQDGKIIYMGPSNDIFYLFSEVLSAPGNSDHNANYIYYGYLNSDYNMDGKAIYIGPESDRAALLYHTLKDCVTGQIPNCISREQLPK